MVISKSRSKLVHLPGGGWRRERAMGSDGTSFPGARHGDAAGHTGSKSYIYLIKPVPKATKDAELPK